MLHLAWRHLSQSPGRLWVSVMGVGLSLTLILALDAVVLGLQQEFTAYIEGAGADIWVAQQGVRNLHMVNSVLPAGLDARIAMLPGVREATSLLYTTQVMLFAETRLLNYVIGLPAGASMGGPAVLAAGRADLNSGEILIDRRHAKRASITLGDQLRLFGRPFEVVGLTEGLSHAVNGVVFITAEDFVRFRRTGTRVSFVLLKLDSAQSSAKLVNRINAELPGVTAISQRDFASEERQVISDMGFEVVLMMNTVSLAIGLAVLVLSIYLTTLSRRHEYGVLRALGAGGFQLYVVVLTQAALMVVMGLAIALIVTVMLMTILVMVDTAVHMQLSVMMFLKVGASSLLLAVIATLVPVLQLARIDPAQVLRSSV